MQNTSLKWAVSIALALALIVIMLGAYTRLTDAGLGCPDWPGCYGRMILPQAKDSLQEAQRQFPAQPIEAAKAWTEMVHRYAAGTLGLFIFFIAFSVLFKNSKANRMERPNRLPWKLPLTLCLLVIFQALLGMWTVTLKLLPVVVMSHLLGGMLIIACLARFGSQIHITKKMNLSRWHFWLALGAVIVFLQIALGGWVSSNYAGIACIGFPRCNGLWLPDLYWSKGFHLFSMPGANYQGGLLENESRVTIHFIHRMGALITLAYILTLSTLIIFRSQDKRFTLFAMGLAVLICLQFLLGIMNVMFLLPIQIAVAHNGVAALILATLLSMLHFTSPLKQKHSKCGHTHEN